MRLEMIDQTTTTSIIDLCPTAIKKVANTNGGEWKGPCPVCGGKDRFSVQPAAGNGGVWHCRQCSKSGDTIGFCEFAFNDTFKAALDRLGLSGSSSEWQPPAKSEAPPAVTPSSYNREAAAYQYEWQADAADFAVDCMVALWKPSAKRVREYLLGRGISHQTMRNANLGYNAGYKQMTWHTSTIKLPRGVVIPWLVGGALYKINLRKSNYDMQQQRQRNPEAHIQSYIQAAGGASHHLYSITEIDTAKPTLMVETELDGLMLESVTTGFNVIAVGSATNGYTPANIAKLATTAHVYCALDQDNAGFQAWLKWQYAIGKQKTTRLQYSHDCKDAGELFAKFGAVGIQNWLNQYVKNEVA